MTSKERDEEIAKLRGEIIKLRENTIALEARVDRTNEKFEKYTTRIEFAPVRILAYGLVGTAMTALVAAGMAVIAKNFF